MNEKSKELIEQEIKSLTDYLIKKDMDLDRVKSEIGEEQLKTLVFCFAVIEKQMCEAAESIRQGNIELARFCLGAGAKRTKDNIYAVLMEAYGGWENFSKVKDIGIPSILIEYLTDKCDCGVKQCKYLENARLEKPDDSLSLIGRASGDLYELRQHKTE